MDPEPVRCRRTDGKKWRCRLPVLPDQKYCERHIHRGRLHSRKPVEVNETLLKSKSESKSKSTSTTSVSTLKATLNLQSDANTNARIHNKVVINNQSFKIKKHFSQKNVVQHGNVRGYGTTENNKKGVLLVADFQRCRRTDGKKWRCRREVLPEGKYCVRHMHRGVKKVENGQKSNTSVSLSVGSSCQQTVDDENKSNESSSSSEATTISM